MTEETNIDKINFDHIYKKGKKINGKYLVTYSIENNYQNGLNSGVVASKKVGNAVKRNRVKRLMRAAITQINKKYKFNLDIILISKHSNGENNKLKMQDIEEDLYKILLRRK